MLARLTLFLSLQPCVLAQDPSEINDKSIYGFLQAEFYKTFRPGDVYRSNA